MNQQINEANFFDKAAAVYLVMRINKPFILWPAFKLGLIDEKGNIIKQPVSFEEKKALGAFDKLIIIIKKSLPQPALGLLSIYSVFKLLTESEIADENQDTTQLDYLYGKMLLEAEERGISEAEVANYLQAKIT